LTGFNGTYLKKSECASVDVSSRIGGRSSEKTPVIRQQFLQVTIVNKSGTGKTVHLDARVIAKSIEHRQRQAVNVFTDQFVVGKINVCLILIFEHAVSIRLE